MEPCKNCPDNTIPYVIQGGDSVSSIEAYIAGQLSLDLETIGNIAWPTGLTNHVIWLDQSCRDLGIARLNFAANVGSTICIPIPYNFWWKLDDYNNPLSEEERELLAGQYANELGEERVADRQELEPQQAKPLTQEQVDRLSAEIATAEYYAELLNTIDTDPTALFAEGLLVPGQELSEEVSEEAHRSWLKRYIITRRLGFKPNMSTEDMENEVRESLIYNHIEGLIAYILEICQRNNSHAICWEMTHGDYIESLKSMSLEALFGEILSLTETIHEMIGQVPDDFYQSDLVASYYDAIDQAQIEAILEEWNQEAERALLDEFLVAISEIPPSILGVDVSIVKIGMLDYYGKMEARHQILAGIVGEQQEAEAQRQAQDAEGRSYYISIISDDTDGDMLDPELLNFSTVALEIEAEQIAYETSFEQDGAYQDFFARKDEIYGTDSYARLKGAAKNAATATMLVLSFVPIVGTGVDIIDALWAISRGDYLGAGLSLMGPIGDVGKAVGRIANLLSAGDNAADALRAFNAIDNLEDSPLKAFIKQGRDAVDDGVVPELHRVAEEMDEVVESLDTLYDLRTSGYPGSKKYIRERETARMVQQETLHSCTPACGRQLLKDDGFDISEDAIRVSAATIMGRFGGTTPTGLARALNNLDPRNIAGESPSVLYRGRHVFKEDELYNATSARQYFDGILKLTKNKPWIAGIQVPNFPGHAVIIDGLETIDDTLMVKLRDPWGVNVGKNRLSATGKGIEGLIPLDDFLEMWHNSGGQTIVRVYQ